tara:strand:+ start:605 stop:2371 length:1767 start_codon:yes stop_codon:yes gene_type:complete
MFTTVFDISFGEAFDNSNNALPVSLNVPSSAPPSGITPYNVKTNIGFYEKKKTQRLFSLQAKEGISSGDIIDISNSYTKKKQTANTLPTFYDISKGPHSGTLANLTTITSETALIENLRLEETEEKNVRKILCIDDTGIPQGPNGETRYDVFYMDSRNLDVSGAPNFGSLNAIIGGPAPKDIDIINSGSDFVGSISTYTLLTDISAGQPVCLNISPSGPITAKACDAETTIQDILGIAIETKSANEDVDILSNGYITAKRETDNNDKTPMAEIRMGTDSGVYGTHQGPVWTFGRNNNGTIKRTNAADPITVTGPIKFLDDGGTGDYSDDVGFRERFDAGEGNTFLMKVNDFSFETPVNAGSFSERLWDWLKIEYSDDNNSWENLNQRVAPNISKHLYYVETDNNIGGVTYDTRDLGGNESATSGTATSDEAHYFPHRFTTTAKEDLQNVWNAIDARYIRFTFYSDSGTGSSGFDIDLDNSAVAGLKTTLTPDEIGAPLYLNYNNYSEVTENDDNGNVLVGYVAGTDVTNNSIYMRTLNFPQSSSSFARIITAVPTSAGIVGEIRFNITDDKLYIWNGETWSMIETTAS